MRALCMAGLLATAATLYAFDATATPVTPTLEFTDGPVASTPVTTGSIAFGGVTVNGAPVVGSTNQAVLQVNGNVSVGGLFNPLQLSATEFNLSLPATAARVAAAISGVLSPLATLSWSVYLDAGNNPLGTATPVASGSFSDPSTLLSLGFTDPVPVISTSLGGPFSLTEFLSISGPSGAVASFNSSVSATPAATVSEPGSLALLGCGLAGLGLLAPVRRRLSATA